ncbi:MAG: hypothetical protein NC200_03860 [Candidatus Gastranaerophilales bacterium]|nr:hypothetical protein [Candidatus Gastranaerophilales bacterium]
MIETKKHEFYKQILLDLYHPHKSNIFQKYTIIGYKSDFLTGLKSIAIKKDDTIIFATIGTNSPQDYIADFKLLDEKIPLYAKKLKSFIEETIKKPINKEYKIILVGHSLGASSNTIIATKYISVNEVVNFNPFGVKGIIKENSLMFTATPLNKIINYCNLNDDIATYKLSNQIGICYTIYTKNPHNAHFIDNLESLSTRIKFDQNDKLLETRIRQRKKTLEFLKNKTNNIKQEIKKDLKNMLNISYSNNQKNVLVHMK